MRGIRPQEVWLIILYAVGLKMKQVTYQIKSTETKQDWESDIEEFASKSP